MPNQGQTLSCKGYSDSPLMSLPLHENKGQHCPDCRAHDRWQSWKDVRKHLAIALLYLMEEGTRPREGR